MSWWRHSRIAQGVVVVLLLWTAADLTNSSLCALDNENASSNEAGSTVLNQGSSGQLPQQPARRHIDDCFCCSHCVELQGFLPAFASVLVKDEFQPVVLPAPRFFGSSLYHPPLV